MEIKLVIFKYKIIHFIPFTNCLQSKKGFFSKLLVLPYSVTFVLNDSLFICRLFASISAFCFA